MSDQADSSQLELLPSDEVADPKSSRNGRATAQTMASQQREISVSEFFSRNRHLLGFDNPRRALLTGIKEAVDNSLDACEEAGFLPEIKVGIKQIVEDRYLIRVEDNGPGIPDRVQSTLFQPFGPSRSSGGSGLGLAIAKELAAKEADILSELAAAQGTAVDLGGYYHTDAEKTARVMRPSETLNGIIG